MHNRIFETITLALAFIAVIGCSAPRLYRSTDKGHRYSGVLPDSTHAALRQLLLARTGAAPKDTIIIKYDFNGETCWDRLDEQSDDQVLGIVSRNQQWMEQLRSARPGISAYAFREPGTRINKLKRWDATIRIDSTRQLMNLLFRERTVCGSSIIVLPDRRFVFLRSDSHSEAFQLDGRQIAALLKQKR